MSYKNAFNCQKCPRTGDPDAVEACPAWWEYTEQNMVTQEVRVQKGCGWALMPKFLIEVVKAANRPAASYDKIANQIAEGFQSLRIVQHGEFGSISQTALVPGGSACSHPKLLKSVAPGAEYGISATDENA
jgi:hypothetical protein